MHPARRQQCRIQSSTCRTLGSIRSGLKQVVDSGSDLEPVERNHRSHKLKPPRVRGNKVTSMYELSFHWIKILFRGRTTQERSARFFATAWPRSICERTCTPGSVLCSGNRKRQDDYVSSPFQRPSSATMPDHENAYPHFFVCRCPGGLPEFP